MRWQIVPDLRTSKCFQISLHFYTICIRLWCKMYSRRGRSKVCRRSVRTAIISSGRRWSPTCVRLYPTVHHCRASTRLRSSGTRFAICLLLVKCEVLSWATWGHRAVMIFVFRRHQPYANKTIAMGPSLRGFEPTLVRSFFHSRAMNQGVVNSWKSPGIWNGSWNTLNLLEFTWCCWEFYWFAVVFV